ncbi:hypothetical protein [Actinoplanes derwentensis]|uniref:Uncharacterized protein n=1 Tax=Actinoplanes derwentensis TaxID=113562 RepID=A0A1H1RNC1_9ACTN|nr:hypothetical protein [Actinoplanes derwentensis]GID84474.1 hypothetical protein Ade03nite_33980 [Actinoplanes derwentensis]SDS37194.1 hypothetical protein SAMN04489716_0639 [Actinoplanes derwentensis]
MTIILKLLLAPALVVAASLAGRRWGQQVSGTLVALPIVAGPILLITCLEQGTDFGSQAAGAALLGLVTLAWFALIFAWLSRWFGWVPTVLISWASCLLLDLALAQIPLGPGWGLLVVLVAAWIVTRLLPADTVGNANRIDWPWWDLPARAAATAVLVWTVTTAADAAGPGLTGVLAPFPIATSVVAAFALAQFGHPSAVRVAHGVPRGLLGFSVFCFLVATLVVPLGTGTAFGIALVATLTIQVGWRAVTTRRASSTHTPEEPLGAPTPHR